MRIKGNVCSNVLDIEDYLPIEGFVEVRLRESISEITEVDSITETEVTTYEYDEYTFHLKKVEGLREEIENNMADWLTTGRTLEVNEGASILMDMKDALGIVGVIV